MDQTHHHIPTATPASMAMPLTPATVVAQKALAEVEATSGVECAALLPLLTRLSVLYREQGLDLLSMETFERIYDIRRKVLPPGHPDLPKALCRCSEDTDPQGKTDTLEIKCRSLTRQLTTIAKTHGPESPASVPVLKEMAQLFEMCDRDSRQIRQAIGLYERILAIQTSALGPEHPDTIDAVVDLASAISSCGKRGRDRAKVLLDGALELQERKHGKDHPGLIPVLCCLAEHVESHGASEVPTHEQILVLHRRILQIKEKTWGPDHADVASWLTMIVYSLIKTREFAEAGMLLSRALAINEKHFGPVSVPVAHTLCISARLEELQGHYDEAERLLIRAVAMQEEFLPASSAFFDGLTRLNDLALTRGEEAKMEACFRRRLEVTERVFGPEHPRATRARADLARLEISRHCDDHTRHQESGSV